VDRATLRIRLLGGFSVEVDGALVDARAWRLRKAHALRVPPQPEHRARRLSTSADVAPRGG
jgi:hypothetical protein